MKFIILVITCFILIISEANSQSLTINKKFTHQDTLRGSITKERAWWDLKEYNLYIKVEPEKKFISGSNTIKYEVLLPYDRMQIDLQAPLVIEKVLQDGKVQKFSNEGNAYFISLTAPQKAGDIKEIKIYYSGNPQVAKNAPWDGGIVWKKDNSGNHFIASACQGLGASVWYPCKDHLYDEVESMQIAVNVPAKLFDVSNGRLQDIKTLKDGTKTYYWKVLNPINNYSVNINIADYVTFSENYNGEKGRLDCDYYVLPDNLSKAKLQFKEVPKMLKAFEHWFGPYPFYEDGYKLVEAPYLGMEHQSCVTYGNKYKNGYLGTDLSGTGWGLKFDFIIVHESAHEWFGNSITDADIADMWIHESFANYSESLYLEYYFGKEAGATYMRGVRNNIQNDIPIIGKYNVNNMGSLDMYYKGANMLHSIRQLVETDEKWRGVLRDLCRTFRHKVVTTNEIETYLSKAVGIDLSKVFDQYLRTVEIPVFEYYIKEGNLFYRWTNTVSGFDLPLKIKLNNELLLLKPLSEWQSVDNAPLGSKIEIDPDFYIKAKIVAN